MRLARGARRWLIAETLPVLYYRYLYGRGNFLDRAVGGLVRRWERRWSLYDAPMPRDVWDRDYEKGVWDYMAKAFEAPRYAAVAGYVRVFARGGAVLDVGCGHGVLLEHLGGDDIGSYLGIDVSQEAIQTARRRAEQDRAFKVADAASFRPKEPVDVIVFNEVLYYLEEPLRQVARYAGHLRAGGVVITSTYHGSPRALAILRRLRERFPLEIESVTTCEGRSWSCSVFRRR